MVLGLPRPSLRAWLSGFSFARLPTEPARKLFLYHFLKEMALSFVFWLLELSNLFNVSARLFCILFFGQSHKILS